MVGLNKIHLNKSQEKLSQKILEDEHSKISQGYVLLFKTQRNLTSKVKYFFKPNRPCLLKIHHKHLKSTPFSIICQVYTARMT